MPISNNENSWPHTHEAEASEDLLKLRDGAWPSGIAVSEQAVRRVHTRGRRRNTSLVYSTRPLGMRVSESHSETRFLKVAQLEPLASIVRAQPTWLRVLEEGRIRRRAPDFAVLIDGRAELHETKQDAECQKSEIKSELLAIRGEVERHPGWRYSVTLESALLAEPLRSNTDLLWRALVPLEEIGLDLRLRIQAVLDHGPLSAAKVMQRAAPPAGRQEAAASWQDLLAMIAGGLIHFDVREKLTRDSLLWNRNSGPERGRTLPFCTVEDAICRSLVIPEPAPFCAVRLRGMAQ